ncbi:MAG: hypothetical protein AAGI67_01835 [Pseudomonadota bacterium]
MGLFDIARPVVFWLDDLITFLPPLLRLALWAAAAAFVGMAVYRLASPQEKLKKLKIEVRENRRAMMEFDGEADEMWPVLAASLGSSLKHLGLTFGGALLAGLPVLLLISPVAQRYGYDLPIAGSLVGFEIVDAEPGLWAWNGEGKSQSVDAAAGMGQISWPETGSTMELAADGIVLASLPLPPGSAVVHKKLWWNRLFANPAGYLDAEAPLTYLKIHLPEKQVLQFGPGWIRGWAFSFFVVLIGFSIALKIWWAIE